MRRLIMAQALPGRAGSPLGADKGYDYPAFCGGAASDGGDPGTWRRTRRIARSAIDARTTRHPGYEVSQRKTEARRTSLWAWMKTVGGPSQVAGTAGGLLVNWIFTFSAAALQHRPACGAC